ncbi:hypothetical protein CFOL_v3_21082 [Cephalotus follicularis]|uniref:Uncharacterized protein n=1 Tax=Cephalotus follicularis TaxID=3775 RepID=A0A1Q3CBZ0_CEPFO|nr:hypothetical protein CFOL_v3_21082 [Cephalotus follicularis]
MRSLCAAAPSQGVLGFHRPSQIPTISVLMLTPRVPPTPFNIRLRNAIKPQVRQLLITAFASNSNPSGRDSLKEEFDGIKTSDTAQGPPFLTILAGLLVFSLVCWIAGSVTVWLIGLIVRLSQFK